MFESGIDCKALKARKNKRTHHNIGLHHAKNCQELHITQRARPARLQKGNRYTAFKVLYAFLAKAPPLCPFSGSSSSENPAKPNPSFIELNWSRQLCTSLQACCTALSVLFQTFESFHIHLLIRKQHESNISMPSFGSNLTKT